MDLPQQISPEDFEQMRAMLEKMGADVALPDRSIRNLCQAHGELCGLLKEFELGPAVLLISSIETIPELHANTLRVEVLLHMAIWSCCGTRQPEIEDLRRWAELLGPSPMAHQEDPTEDVFVGYVCTPRGGFRVYAGIFSNADFIIERLLFFLEEKTNFPSFQETYESVLELLKVSEAIADELGHLRYSGSKSLPTSPIQVPGEDRVAKHSKAIHFDGDRLLRLGIDLHKLGPFLFKPEDADDFESKPFFGSPVESRPLLPSNNGFIVASPSCICRAAVIHILEAAPHLGGWADTFFEQENAEFFINEVIHRLGIQALQGLKLPPTPESIPHFYPYVGQFDHGMAAISFVISSPVSKKGDLQEAETFTDEQVSDFTRYVGACCAAIEAFEGFRGGLILFALAGVGRPVAFGFGDLRANWHLFSAGLADWQTLSKAEDFSAKRLWYLGLQQDFAETANIELINTAGLLNLYAFWKQQDFSLVHKDIDSKNPSNIVWIAEDYAQSLNIQLKSTTDRHCCPSPDQTGWILLQREGHGLNPNLATNLRYYDHEAARNGRLRGCIERQTVVWWLEANIKPATPDSRNLLYRLWDCVFHWLERVLPVLSSDHPDWMPGRMRFLLGFPKVDDWDLQSAIKPSGGPAELDWEADPATAEVKLTFVEDFLQKFYRSDNLAEREIVATVLRALALVAGATPSDSDIEDCVRRVVRGDGTRFFHVVKASTLESVLGGPENADPSLIPYEEIARVHLGLAFKVDVAAPRCITDSKKAQRFLDNVVAHLQSRVCSKLQQLAMLPVVSYSFTQLDELSRDGHRWSLSTRALLALEDGADWMHERLRQEKSRITMAEIANRALIETAVYCHNPKANEIISQTEHASLLAEFAVMIELANHRDAIAYGFAPPDMTIHPNGTLDYDDTFQQEVFQPYLKSRIDEKIQWDSEAYDTYFGEPNPPENPPQDTSPEVTAFQQAFRSEFGFSYDALDKIVEQFDELAFADGKSGGSLGSREFRWLLKEKAGLTDPQVTSFLERFVLPIRASWDKNLPRGCDRSDVLPWRYYRGLSVLVRPFVEISRSPRHFVISAPQLHRWLRYLTASIAEGHLPARIFQSSQMRSYLGSIADKKGHQFTEEVAELFQSILSNQRVEIKMTELGAPADPDLGDIDVLAWDPKTGVVLLIECKRLKTALTVRQVIQQLEHFRGDATDKEDALAKHQRRMDWLKQNPSKLSRITGIPEDQILWKPLVVTKGRVPMSFVDAIDFPKDQVVPMRDLESYVTDLVARNP